MDQAEDCFTVALPVQRGRISPFFDAARRVLVVELVQGEERSRWEVVLPDDEAWSRFSELQAQGVEALVCGAISNRSLSEALHLGLRVWSAVEGGAEEVIASLASRGALDQGLGMPGASPSPYCRDLAWTGGSGPRIWGWRVGAARIAGASRCG